MGWFSYFINTRLGRIVKNRNLRRLVFAFPIYYTLTDSVADWYLVQNGSMEPTLLNGQLVLVLPVRNPSILPCYFDSLAALDKFIVPYNDIKRGDLIVARHPSGPGNIIKRVTGVEGDRIPLEYRQSHRFVPEGQVWVEGDNSTGSKDSRHYGPIPLGLLRGKVVGRMWPVKECGMVE